MIPLRFYATGGFNMSGTESKAGGPDYLYLFTQAKSVAEKLLPVIFRAAMVAASGHL